MPRYHSLGPIVTLLILNLAVIAALHAITGGRELSDDAPHLIHFVRNPWILWQDPHAAGLSATWGAFPPLFPPLFATLVLPWLAALPEFGAIRAGVLSWTLLAMLSFRAFAARVEGLGERPLRMATWLYALTPLVIAATSVLPQEESFVSLFAIALCWAARRQRLALVAGLFALSAVAAKVFLLVLVFPIALASSRPLRNLFLFGFAGAGALGAYLAYQGIHFGELPLLSYRLEPAAGISIWALLWNLGLKIPQNVLQPLSLLLTACLTLGFCWLARKRSLPLTHSVAVTLWITTLCVAIAMPPYLLWNLPFLLIAITRMDHPGMRWASIGLLFAWCGTAYGAKLFRGVHLTLAMDRSEGKDAVADLLVRVLGSDFPYHAAQTLLIALCVAIGITYVALLWINAKRVVGGGPEARPHQTQMQLGNT
jgi:hypothetical protein